MAFWGTKNQEFATPVFYATACIDSMFLAAVVMEFSYEPSRTKVWLRPAQSGRVSTDNQDFVVRSQETKDTTKTSEECLSARDTPLCI